MLLNWTTRRLEAHVSQVALDENVASVCFNGQTVPSSHKLQKHRTGALCQDRWLSNELDSYVNHMEARPLLQ